MTNWTAYLILDIVFFSPITIFYSTITDEKVGCVYVIMNLVD